MAFALTDIPYEDHPAFKDIAFNSDRVSLDLALRAQEAIEQCLARARVPSFDVNHALTSYVQPTLDELKEFLKKNQAGSAVHRHKFIDEFFAKLSLLLKEDLFIASRRGCHAYVPGSPAADKIFQALVKQGYIILHFSQSAVDNLQKLMAPFQEKILENYQNGKTDRNSLHINSWSPHMNSALSAIFNDRDVLGALQNYMGMKIGYTGVAFELSVPQSDWWRGRYPGHESMEAAYMHLDQSTLAPKMLCYLSDVKPANGATTVFNLPLQGPLLAQAAGRAMDTGFKLGDEHHVTQHLLSQPWGRECFAMLPKPLRGVGHFGNDILPGSPLEDLMVRNRVVMTGDPGTCVVFDGARVVHRGSNCTEGTRWAFQVVYGPVQ